QLGHVGQSETLMYNRREFLQTLMVGGAGLALFPSFTYGQADRWTTEYNQILSRIKPPKFRKKDLSILKFGAKEGGGVDCCDAINQAIDECSRTGGGRVVVSKGVFLTGAIRLKSNVNLHVSKGATLKFSPDASKYPIVATRFEGMECMNVSPFIYAFEQTNVAVTGEGTLDGQSNNEHWWNWHGSTSFGGKAGEPNQKAARARLYKMMEDGTSVKDRVFGPDDRLRPNFIQPHRCKNVLVEGVNIINSPMWEIHPLLCENVTVRKVRISSHGPNNDGCDPESCKDVLIEDCYFDTGDDCIAIKSGRNEDGRRLNLPTENVIVRGCEMKDGHGGITIGSEISGGVRNVFGENCNMDSPNLDHALRVKNNASRGGLLENFYFRNIKVGQVKHALITIDFNYEEGAKGKHTPVMHNFCVENLTSGKSKFGVDIQGLDNAQVTGLEIKNSAFNNVSDGNIVKNLIGVKLDRVKFNGKIINSLK
ncbi:MAG: glycoside hydrolase family 28 protein, partial [Pyrinomonadaceae bacterium]